MKYVRAFGFGLLGGIHHAVGSVRDDRSLGLLLWILVLHGGLFLHGRPLTDAYCHSRLPRRLDEIDPSARQDLIVGLL